MKNLKPFKENNRFELTPLVRLPFIAALLLALFLVVNKGFSQAPNPPKSYVCYKPDDKIIIDGKLNEKSWKKAEWTSRFEDIEGAKKPLPLQDTRVKMLWDNEYLYIAAVLDEEHIWAYQDKKDQIVFHENDFEVFIDPDGDTENYYELEINAINNTFDLFLPKTYKKGGRAQIPWDIKNLKSAVSIDGTLNDGKDKDKSWTLEIAIPFNSLANENVAAIIPKHDSIWRINFSRVNWQHEIGNDGKYSRRKNKQTNKFIPEYNWVWSPQGIINMHFPEYWGYLHFNAGIAGKKQKQAKSK